MAKYVLPQDELLRASNWISNFLMREGYHADYTIESLSEIDKFFKEKLNLVLESDNNRNFIFSISAYIGEVIRMKYHGSWEVSHNIDLYDETIGISFKNHKTIYPLNITLELIQKKYTMQEYLKNNF
ncbi:hypothetical protein [Brachyspira pulli]|uniref:hypothetical protein n=1 Tax=Brachyspira pulli TaxID=310721 RepID=UPI003005C456